MTVRDDYQGSSEAAVRHWEFNYALLENATPTATEPFAVLSRLAGTQIVGTVLAIDATNSIIVGDVTHSMVYQHLVRNVRTYAGAAEATWGVIAEGAPIYYDRSGTMPAGTYLSTSPLDAAAAANPLFGHAVMRFDGDANIPTTVATAATETLSVMQKGA